MGEVDGIEHAAGESACLDAKVEAESERFHNCVESELPTESWADVDEPESRTGVCSGGVGGDYRCGDAVGMH